MIWQAENIVAGMMIGFPQRSPALEMLSILFGVGELVQRAANHGLGLLALGGHDGFETFLPLGNEDIASQEVVEVGPMHQGLRHHRVVVVVYRNVAVGTDSCLSRPDRMRKAGAESLAAISLRGDCLLLEIDPLAIGVLRADENRAG